MRFRTFHFSSNWLSILTAIACALAGNSLLAAPAKNELPSVTVRAAPAKNELPSMTVSYFDLDLATPAGVQTLYDRMKDAARTVCASLESKQLGRMSPWRDCYQQAVEDAVATVDRPALTALYQAERTTKG
jgi:UrcA family protein